MTRTRFMLVPIAALMSACAVSSEVSSDGREQLSTAECNGASPWAEWHAYAIGDLVAYAGNTYRCVQPHTSQPGWTPSAVPALWQPVGCSGGGGGGTPGCDPNAWVYMGSDPSACTGHVGESCGWTPQNEGQGYHCQTVSWGVGCEPGGAACSGGAPPPPSPPPPPPPPGGGGGDYTESFSTWYCGDACGMNDTGSCGTTYCETHVGSGELGAALSQIRMNGASGTWMGGGLCGKQIEVVALDTGRSIVVPVIDACEACNQDDHVDLTLDVWKALGVDPCAGKFRQKWRFVN